MTKIKNLDRKALADLRPQIDEALAELGERLGLKLTAGNGSYGGNAGHFKLNIEVDDAEVREVAEREAFDRVCHLFDLEPSDRGREFRAGNKAYKLLGFEMSRSKYPIRVEDVSAGKVVLLTEMAIPAIKAARPAEMTTA